MIINTLLIIIAIAVSAIILIAQDWRWVIFGLTSIFIVAFILIVQIWPLALSAVKLISGLMGVTLLSLVRASKDEQVDQEEAISSRIFIFLLACLSWIIVSSTITNLNEWLPISYTNLYIGMVILLTGIIKFSIFQDLFDILIGMLVFLSGFDIIYSSLEGSALVTGIYAMIILSICILGSYLEGIFTREVEEE